MPVHSKRIYEAHSPADGYRVLVDRLWPRGLKKETAEVALWLKEVAPSTELRKWFNHDPQKWTEFKTRYRAELKGSPAWDELRGLVRTHKALTLLYAAKDEQHNQAIALLQFLEEAET